MLSRLCVREHCDGGVTQVCRFVRRLEVSGWSSSAGPDRPIECLLKSSPTDESGGKSFVSLHEGSALSTVYTLVRRLPQDTAPFVATSV